MSNYNAHTDDYEPTSQDLANLARGREANKAVAAATRAKIAQLYRLKWPTTRIAAELNLHFTTVYAHLRALGVPKRRFDRKAKVRALLAQGVPRTEIARQTGLTIATVHVYAWELKHRDPLLL